MSPPPNDVYARLLFAEAQGLPLWDPSLDANSPREYREHGIQVGDVGYHSRDGRFIFLSNISLPRDHPINAWRGNLPDSFEPITLGMPDYRPAAYPPPSVFLHTNSGKVSLEGGVEANIPKTPLEAGFSFRHQSNHAYGAALVLRNGGSHINHDQDLSMWAERNARFCYEYAASLAYPVPNGGIYFVTGATKTHNWHISTFSEASGGNFASFKIGVAGVLQGKIAASQTIHETNLHTPRHSPPKHCFRNQTVFIRGWKIMLNQRLWKSLDIKPRARLIDLQYSKFDKVKMLGPIIYQPEVSSQSYGRQPLLSVTPSSDPAPMTQTPSLESSSNSNRDSDPSLKSPTSITNGEEPTKTQEACNHSSIDLETNTKEEAGVNEAQKKRKKRVRRGGNSRRSRRDDDSSGGGGSGGGGGRGSGGHGHGASNEGGGSGSRRNSDNHNGQDSNSPPRQGSTQTGRQHAGGQAGEEREGYSDHGVDTVGDMGDMSSDPESEGTLSDSSEDFESPYQPYHPSDVINRFLFSEYPDCEVALTHDSMWCSALKLGVPADDDLPSDETLIEKLRLVGYRSDLSEDGRTSKFILPLALPMASSTAPADPVPSEVVPAEDVSQAAPDFIYRRMLRAMPGSRSLLQHTIQV